jgi:hypothetical protein
MKSLAAVVKVRESLIRRKLILGCNLFDQDVQTEITDLQYLPCPIRWNKGGAAVLTFDGKVIGRTEKRVASGYAC